MINADDAVAWNEECREVATADAVYLLHDQPIGEAEPENPGVAVNDVGVPTWTTQSCAVQ